MFSKQVLEAAKAHGIAQWPLESVGYVVAGTYVPQENISTTPMSTFEVCPSAWLSSVQIGTIQAVIHSHPIHRRTNSAGVEELVVCDYPNAIDMRGQINSGVPLGIFTCDAASATEPFFWGDAVPIPPLTGTHRFFRHGVMDCYSLIRDYYRVTFGIALKEHPRDWDWWNVKQHGSQVVPAQDLYTMGFQETGFRTINSSELRRGDVFLAQIPRTPVPCHGGIYLGGSGDMILHHLCSGKPVDYTRLAVEEPGIRYLKYATHFLRYEVNNENN